MLGRQMLKKSLLFRELTLARLTLNDLDCLLNVSFFRPNALLFILLFEKIRIDLLNLMYFIMI